MIQNYLGGAWREASATESLPIRNPATGEEIGRVPLSTASDVDAAVQAAKAAFPAWRSTPSPERARVMFRFRALLEEHKEELATQLTIEHGKIIAETRGEVQRGIENVEHACGIPTLMMGDTIEEISSGIDSASWRQPLGVFSVITPYNFPVMIPLWFWPYAVATGNTVVLKPSEQDPLTHQKIVELAEQAGLPPGVLNVVHGGQQVVESICDHPDIVGVSFVGSSRVAEIVYKRAANAGKRVQTLGGAKNYLIVLPDADMDATLDACAGSIFGSTGQRCLAGSVVVGVGDAHPQIRERLMDYASSIRLGDGLVPGTDMGPVISAPHRDRVNAFIDQGVADGATLSLDGRDASVEGFENGYWIGPSVFEDVAPDISIGTEEIFGPVATINRAKTVDEAIAMMQASRYGNACSLFTNNGGAAREFRYQAGISMIGINIGVAAPMAFFPFGGSKGSFFGDLKAQGRDAIAFYTDQRVVISRWSNVSADPHHPKES
ncbi:MAG: CoA-acylating methylmalonate-semialdehyde dehydrogenase [Gemmatimonadales bacterium]|jgi:malonate-semialdehyde dehydrogenase (acetylating)/methylmalonate-semialdehyde dehydrogenase|nr:CoA-acylating methylmalonate-semialdehyde dehydrogenase [Gemmatimonadales bacterium]MDG2241641.1 CoA-acylating methylmalonate-semialdehyde dehydrogenase [Longimicrobiales bacterium]MBT3775463.1 CoA-acylating methylmalonate-semialdehyde dehydrogenase [Gemmatimonadales bacterium]MBT3958608.1 CoA-acylating methylmalonate-semialdehyde dehydrogenase [Gemmatimonadales bacterium]MBT4188222.1 CoA-acylating methylmalonate-semialdehyde dehydrogenase [Gemmatimonadales bacterium]